MRQKKLQNEEENLKTYANQKELKPWLMNWQG